MRMCVMDARALVDALEQGIDDAMGVGEFEFDVDLSQLSEEARSTLQRAVKVGG